LRIAGAATPVRRATRRCARPPRAGRSGLAALADERTFALRMRLAGLLGTFELVRLARVVRRGVARRRLDAARLREIAARLVVAAAGFVVAFALDLVLGRCLVHGVSFALRG